MKTTSTFAIVILIFAMLIMGSRDALGQRPPAAVAPVDCIEPRIVVDGEPPVDSVEQRESTEGRAPIDCTEPRIVVDGEAPIDSADAEDEGANEDDSPPSPDDDF